MRIYPDNACFRVHAVVVLSFQPVVKSFVAYLRVPEIVPIAYK